MTTQKIKTFLWFDNDAEEAVAHYIQAFEDSEVLHVARYGEAGPGTPGSVMTIAFRLAGQEYVALNGGPQFPFTEAISLQVTCDDQAEVDRLWAHLTADGGEESMCGWLKDRFGLSWQIVPQALFDVFGGDDPAGVQRATTAMLGMRKLDAAALRQAYAGA